VRLYRVIFTDPETKDVLPSACPFNVGAFDAGEAEQSARDVLNIPARYRAEVREA
jgi:hypothetical protein